MNDRTITKEDKQLASLFQTIDQLSETIENIVRNIKPGLDGEQYLTDKDMSKLLKISRRCLQDYRSAGKIPFYRIGGKILYKVGDVEHFLNEHYENKQGFTGI
ncbi:MAG: helix-turn-helix domain-containing protein [Dysgonamonadaceae bacterium]|jgi:excisionase family DNA binding protein|nr:helix-turn-helix domain-containing protein [Dysgonamonadaceae bacterium]